MAETISLRAYLGQVEDLLNVGQTDEVIHHCRHILQYFPRNVAAYRLLGKALLQKRRWDEARAVFLRVLSARPDDFDSHVGLCDVYEQKGQTNDAIWHLERAFEQRPADRAVIDRLREMYRTHRNVNATRMQLTTAAVARQQSSGGFNDRALDTLRTVLSRSPDRIDLRLLLAQTLWNNDQRIEAAETALDVLEKLPDCIDANAIMTQLWLSEDRPSDAQRFLNRLEATDPYLALELVQGQSVPDESFMLDELDYRRYAQREMATSRPDWLEGIESSEFKELLGDTNPRAATTSMTDRLRPSVPVTPTAPPDEDWPDLFSNLGESDAADHQRTLPTTSELFGGSLPTAPAKPLSTDDLFGDMPDTFAAAPSTSGPTTDDLFGDMPDEWSQEWADSGEPDDEPEIQFPPPQPPRNTGSLFGAAQEEPPAPAQPAPKQSGRLFDYKDPIEAIEPPKTLEGRSTATGDLPDWLQNTEETIEPAKATSGLRDVKQDDDGSWAYDDGEQNFQQFIEDDEPITIPPENIDPMDWLRKSGAEIDEEGQRHRPSMYDDGGEGGVIADPVSDPMSWMKGSGIELEDQMPDSLTGGGNSGSLEWMNSKTLPDVDLEAAAIEARSGSSDVDFFTWLEQQQQSNRVNADDVTIDDDPLEWLSSDDLLADLDADDDIPGEVDAGRPFDRPGGEAGSGDATQFDDQVPAHILAQTQHGEPNSTIIDEQDTFVPTEPANEAERLTAMADQKQGPDWLSNNSDDDLEWLNGSNESDANAHLADWLSQGLDDEEDEQAAAPLADFDWVDENEPDHEASSTEPEPAVPEWLTDLGTNYTQPETSLYAAEVTEPEFPVAEERAPATGTPDWLSDLGANYTQPETSLYAAASAAPESPAEQELAASADMPDWLSGLGTNYTQPETLPTFAASEPEPEPAAAEPEPQVEVPLARADWGNSDEMPTEDEPELESATPDWITALDPQTAVSMATVTESDSDEAVPADVPDWMASLNPEATDDTPAWMSSAEPDAEPDVPAPEGQPEWLSSVEPETETDAVAADIPDWIAGIKPETIDDRPSWLSSIAADATQETPKFTDASVEPDTQIETNAVAVDMPDWMASMQPEEPSDAPSWMSSSKPDAAPDVPIPASAPDWLSSDQPEDENNSALEWIDSGASAPEPVAPAPAAAQLPGTAEMLDWLSELKPSETPDTSLFNELGNEIIEPAVADVPPVAAEQELPVAGSVTDWMSSLEPESADDSSLQWLEGEAPEPVAELPSSQPNASSFDWVNDLAGSDEPESELDDWMASTPSSLSEIAAAEQPPVTDFEWLNATRQTEEIFTPQGDDEPEIDYPEPLVAASDAAATSGGFNWPTADDSTTGETVGQADVPDWLQALQPAEETPAPEVEAAPSFSWLDAASDEQPAAETQSDTPDWLSGIGSGLSKAEPAVPAKQIDWLSGIGNVPSAQAEPEPVAEAEPVEAAPQFDFDAATSSLYDPVEEDAMDTPVTAEQPEPAVTQLLTSDFEPPVAAVSEPSVTEHVPAENAPDWLNAMVPGVDLDYAPAEDETPEEAVAEQPSPTQEFDWLLDMVEEETQPASEPVPEPEPEPVIAQTEAKPKFAFSKLPSWLRKDDAATR